MLQADSQTTLLDADLEQEVPLCVDLDGTLVGTDLLVESWFALLKRSPLAALQAPLWLWRGKARLKHEIARRVDLDVCNLPYNSRLLEYLRLQHRDGRRLVLATASNQKYANQIARHLGIFDRVIASDAQTNLCADRKRHALTECFGSCGYDYAGNASCDMTVFAGARQAILVNAAQRVERAARGVAHVVHEFSPQRTLKPYLQALRPHQWLKNLLLFVPLIAAHRMTDPALLAHATFGFIAFSLCASSVYLLNDLLDLPADRAHSRKRERPFASGAASARVGILLIPALLIPAFAIALSLSHALAAVLGVYLASTLVYSLWLKGKVLMDVLVLAALYTLRILAGAAAVGVQLSFWLLAFAMFIFLSLAMVKRYAELLDMKHSGVEVAHGRGYTVMDLGTIQTQGVASAYCAVLVLALYVNSSEVRENYTHPQTIWLLCPLLLYWISRVWQKAGLGVMHDDPLIFALRDRVSRWLAAASAVVLLAASWV